MLGELIDLVSGIDKAKDILGRVYEYFLLNYLRSASAFARARSGEG
jgi:hypothetical protein